MEILIKIQKELKAPKNQFNAFGKYKYRSCEDILEAVKPLCEKYGALLTLTDDITETIGHLFVKSIASFQHEQFKTSVTAYAMHPLEKKGMDASQITGAASSYARKYALSGLFLIDDNKDADASGETGDDMKEIIAKIESSKTIEEIVKVWNENPGLQTNEFFVKACGETKKKLKNALNDNSQN
jgi:hypothetical protein